MGREMSSTEPHKSRKLEAFIAAGQPHIERIKRRRREQLSHLALKSVLDEARENFERTHDPIFVWFAIRHCLRRKASLPDWAIHYLGQCADAIAMLVQAPPPDVAPALMAAIGFEHGRGRSSSFYKFAAAYRQERAAVLFAKRVLNGERPTKAAQQVAHIVRMPDGTTASDTTIWRWVRQFYEVPRSSPQGGWLGFFEQLASKPEFFVLLSKFDE